jgi:hypothetical protein
MGASKPKSKGMSPLGMEMDDVVLFPLNEPSDRKDCPQIEFIPNSDRKDGDFPLLSLQAKQPFGITEKMIVMVSQRKVVQQA